MSRKEPTTESPQMEEIVESTKQISLPFQPQKGEKIFQSEEVQPTTTEPTKYASKYYQAAKIPFCSDCGEKRRTSTDGKQFCPSQNPNCSFVK